MLGEKTTVNLQTIKQSRVSKYGFQRLQKAGDAIEYRPDEVNLARLRAAAYQYALEAKWKVGTLSFDDKIIVYRKG